MPELPTGTITFLFTDVEGSTRRWEEYPQIMRGVMERHDALLTAIFEQHDGVVVRPRGEGDSLFVVFVRATDAVAGAIAGQRALAAEDWGEVGPLRVRMGMHTGEADLREGDYYGRAVNRCARIRGAGSGGQILVSHTTAVLVRYSLPPESGLSDLGKHRLKDLTEPEQLYQLDAPGLPPLFPGLKTLDSHPNNLPNPLTSFIGREAEVAAIVALLGSARLVTLTGPGGTGKTRLALQTAAEVLHAFADGVFFVDLTPISDVDLVAGAIGQTLGVRESPGQAPFEALQSYLSDKNLLLVLDNFEQVADAATLVSKLLAACPALKALVTSRIVLRLTGEREFFVSPLAVPTSAHEADPEALQRYPAIALFVERAAQVRPDFALTPQNGQAVAEICARLDGLPLAIELAAARIRVLTPQALLGRLGARLTLLTGGARNAPTRQQTLRGAIAWSYDLLDPAEQTLYCWLAMFAGGCDLDAAEVVCSAAGLDLDVLDGVESLVEKSLLGRADESESIPRYPMLATIREFGLEQLAAGADAATAWQSFIAYWAEFAEQAEAALAGPDQGAWLQRLERDHDNLRAALDRALAVPDAAAAQRLAGALWRFWEVRGYLTEGRSWLDRVLALSVPSPTVAASKVLNGAGWLAMRQGDHDRAARLQEQNLALSRELRDARRIVSALINLATVERERSNYAAARTHDDEALALARASGDRRGAALAGQHLGLVGYYTGDLAAAWALQSDALALFRALGDRGNVANCLSNLGAVADRRGEFLRAVELYQEALALYRELNATAGTIVALMCLGRLARLQADRVGAQRLCEEALALCRELGDRQWLAPVLEELAHTAATPGSAARAVRYFGAAAALREVLGTPLPPVAAAEQSAAMARLRTALGAAAFTDAWDAGRSTPLDDLLRAAIASPVRV